MGKLPWRQVRTIFERRGGPLSDAGWRAALAPLRGLPRGVVAEVVHRFVGKFAEDSDGKPPAYLHRMAQNAAAASQADRERAAKREAREREDRARERAREREAERCRVDPPPDALAKVRNAGRRGAKSVRMAERREAYDAATKADQEETWRRIQEQRQELERNIQKDADASRAAAGDG